MEVEIIVFSKISHIQKAKYHSFVEPRTNIMMMMVMMGTNTNGGSAGRRVGKERTLRGEED
jgi:hypothetical protein